MKKGLKYSDDSELIKRFNARDKNAITAIYIRLYRQLCAYSYKIVKQTDEAEDLVTEEFEKLLQNSGTQFETVTKVQYYLYTAVRWASLNHLQKQERQRDKQAFIATDSHDEPIINVIMKAELVAEVYNEIHKFPEKDQRLIELSFVDGKTTGEISRILGIEEQSVRNRKNKLIGQLRIAMIRKSLTILFLINFLRN